MQNTPEKVNFSESQIQSSPQIWPKTQFDEFGNCWKTEKSGLRYKIFKPISKQLSQKALLEKEKCVITSINYLPNKAIWRAKKDQVIRNSVFRDDIQTPFSHYKLIHDPSINTRIHLITTYIPKPPTLVPASQDIQSTPEEPPEEDQFVDPTQPNCPSSQPFSYFNF